MKPSSPQARSTSRFTKPKFKHGIGFRLSLYSAVLSLLFTAVVVSILFYLDYKFQRTQLETDIDRVFKTVEQQLTKSLWDVDVDSLQVGISALNNLPYIEGVQVFNYSEGEFSAGNPGGVVALKKSLVFEDEVLADVEIFHNSKFVLDTVYKKYRTVGFVLLFTVGSMGLIFYLIFDQSLIRHIRFIALAKSHNEFNEDQDFEPLRLPRGQVNDELGYLVDVLNKSKMQAIELIQARKERQEQVEYQANYDLLTGLSNRHHLYDYLGRQMREYSPEQGSLILMFIDIDGFKQVNDSLGHSVGDGVLKVCADRIGGVAKEVGAYSARLGGDEFILTFYRQNSSDYQTVARQMIDAFDHKISFEGVTVKLGCSIGVSTYPNHELATPNEFIQSADVALYQAKAAGRNTYMQFNNDMLETMILEKNIKDKLVTALADNAFEIYYQPLVELHSGEIVGFEALLRWYDDELGWIRPDAFIPIAEKTGLVFAIDLWVFERASEQVRQWQKIFGRDFIVSINFSPTGFYHSDFSRWLKESHILNSRQKTDWIELEITERLILNDDPLVLSGIDRLREKGVSFSIDDFGVGHSSLGYLKMFSHRLSKIKIDRIFINGLGSGRFDMAFIKSIMMLAESLDLDVLAEGIEQQDQAVLLRDAGCRFAQGYHYARPMPVAEVESMLVANKQACLPAALSSI